MLAIVFGTFGGTLAILPFILQWNRFAYLFSIMVTLVTSIFASVASATC
jgi:hypothetical protein